ncbi:tRNA/tmRNA (uracil-C(5))-methyltransferase [Symbiodinium microadriaticum]|uniref:tRNA/tmRNA (Uracil-C(5))-methyltransferase n=1 Tax=Symbiodinium microadriaticum TaxID=2951 RepID=A0A1Q9DL23_SYMMI|nr:tRNA/tmRNA (uracil-C(5))-methyltransferase [Symbiodinium microadriaticum]
MEDAGQDDEAFETPEERMAWLRARGVRIEEPGQSSGPAPSGQGRSFAFVRIPVEDAQTCEELDGPHCKGDALPTLLGPRFAGCSLSDEQRFDAPDMHPDRWPQCFGSTATVMLCPCLAPHRDDEKPTGIVDVAPDAVVQALASDQPVVLPDEAVLLGLARRVASQPAAIIDVALPLNSSEPLMMGISFESPDGQALLISDVSDGTTNRKDSQSVLKQHDRVLSVEGHHGDAEALQSLIAQRVASKGAATLKMKVVRPRKLLVYISDTGKLGMELKYKDFCTGAIISEIEDDGIVAKWNSHHPEVSVAAGDYIVSVNDISLPGPELLKALATKVNIKMTELRAYAAAQGQAGVDLAVLRKLVMRGQAESFSLAVPTAANGREAVYAYLDEASELKGLAVNERAVAVARSCGFPSSCRLRGDVYIGRLKWSDGGLVENVDFRIGELQPGAPWMQRAVTENLEQQKATQPEQHAAAQGGDPDQRAEGVGDGYTWKDDDEELEILLDVPESTKRKDVKIEFRRQEVRRVEDALMSACLTRASFQAEHPDAEIVQECRGRWLLLDHWQAWAACVDLAEGRCSPMATAAQGARGPLLVRRRHAETREHLLLSQELLTFRCSKVLGLHGMTSMAALQPAVVHGLIRCGNWCHRPVTRRGCDGCTSSESDLDLQVSDSPGKEMRRFWRRRRRLETSDGNPAEPTARCPPLAAPDPDDYPSDLSEKVDAVQRLLGQRLDEDAVDRGLEVMASPEPLHYRHRVKFDLQHDGDTVRYVVFDPDSTEWLAVDSYPLASRRINRLMSDLLDLLAHEAKLREKAFQVELISTTRDEALACILYHRRLSLEDDKLQAQQAAAALDAVVVLRAKGQRLAWPARRSFLVQENEIEGKAYPQWLMENSFFQANLHLNREMQSWVAAQTQIEGEARDLLEMYCGNGNFTLPVAGNFRRVLANEIDEPAVRGAEICAKKADVHNIQFRRCRAESLVLESQIRPVGPYDFSTLLVDPPRSGLDDRSRAMVESFENLIYVSCNPRSLARDLEALQSHRIQAACLFDQFPWTDHSEVALRLIRRQKLGVSMPRRSDFMAGGSQARQADLTYSLSTVQRSTSWRREFRGEAEALKNWLQRVEVPIPAVGETLEPRPLPTAERAISTALKSIEAMAMPFALGSGMRLHLAPDVQLRDRFLFQPFLQFVQMAPATPVSGLFADVQVAYMPFERNWQHLAVDPFFFFLEVGANNHELERDFLEPMLQDRSGFGNAGGFLISFEPLLDKYGFLLAYGAPSMHFANLGLQHRRTLVLPYAVSTCDGPTATFHVAPIDGCSSLRAPASDFKRKNMDETRYTKSWPKWVEENCSALAERRDVPCISLAVVLSEWLAGRPIARMKIDAQGSDLDVVKSAGPYLKQLLFIVMETQGTFEALLYEGQASCDQVQAEMRALGFILADTRSLPACNRTGALPYPFHEEDIAFVRRELHHLWRDFYYEHPYCQHGIVSAAGACGGPYCMAPEFNMHVNRSGGCADQIQDILAFPSDAIGMVLLWTSANCIRNIEVTMDGMGPRNLRVQVLQGRARGKRQCPSKFDAVQSLHGPIVRVRSGSSDHRVQMLLLPGFLNITSAKLEEALEYFFYVVENSGASNFHLIWPRACVELRADALPHRISTGYRPVNQPSGSAN